MPPGRRGQTALSTTIVDATRPARADGPGHDDCGRHPAGAGRRPRARRCCNRAAGTLAAAYMEKGTQRDLRTGAGHAGFCVGQAATGVALVEATSSRLALTSTRAI